ncbi:MAG: methyl-accepting chemotaxis protein [Vampirovibrionales bacterium]
MSSFWQQLFPSASKPQQTSLNNEGLALLHINTQGQIEQASQQANVLFCTNCVGKQVAQLFEVFPGGWQSQLQASTTLRAVPTQQASVSVLVQLLPSTNESTLSTLVLLPQPAIYDEMANAKSQMNALNKVQAVIEFDLQGTILKANDNFLNTVGYRWEEIAGQHHRMFAPPGLAESQEYRDFWKALASGANPSGEYYRIGKHGKNIWIQASYNTVFNEQGNPYKVVKFAIDITSQVLKRQQASDISDYIQQVATGAEELNASVQDISNAMQLSNQSANQAYNQAQLAEGAQKQLANCSHSMGNVVSLIHSITDQINLLALNATIESARAGEAGRGFAVVANEVKNLAGQAQKATDQIAKEIDGVWTASNQVERVLGEIKQSITQVREYVESTSLAVNEQSHVTQHMSQSLQEVANKSRLLV